MKSTLGKRLSLAAKAEAALQDASDKQLYGLGNLLWFCRFIYERERPKRLRHVEVRFGPAGIDPTYPGGIVGSVEAEVGAE